MSIYYNYYLGYQTTDGKIYPLGPFDYKNRYCSIISKSSSFASDLYEDFYCVQDRMITKELANAMINYDKILSENDKINELKSLNLKYLDISLLPSDNYIKEGYFLIEDVQKYLSANINDREELIKYEIFFDKLSKEVYAAKLQNELIFKEDKQIENEKSCRDYMYFAYPDYTSKEYEVHQILISLNAYNDYDIEKDAKYVVIQETN